MLVLAHILYILGLCALIVPNLFFAAEPFAFFRNEYISRIFGIACIIPIFMFNYFRGIISNENLFIPALIFLSIIALLLVIRLVIGWRMLPCVEGPSGREIAAKKVFSGIEGVLCIILLIISMFLAH